MCCDSDPILAFGALFLTLGNGFLFAADITGLTRFDEERAVDIWIKAIGRGLSVVGFGVLMAAAATPQQQMDRGSWGSGTWEPGSKKWNPLQLKVAVVLTALGHACVMGSLFDATVALDNVDKSSACHPWDPCPSLSWHFWLAPVGNMVAMLGCLFIFEPHLLPVGGLCLFLGNIMYLICAELLSNSRPLGRPTFCCC